MKIKVCGITTVKQLEELQGLNVDYAGLIFYKKSKRYAGDLLMNLKDEVKNTGIYKIGVFVNEDKGKVLETIEKYGLAAVQLHGDESGDYCSALKERTKVIKAVRVLPGDDLRDKLEAYENSVDFSLFDTGSSHKEVYGGTGNKFDWNSITGIDINKPFFLSGGISGADVEKIKEFDHPKLFAVDINSRFETSPGVKDMQLVESFVKTLRNDQSKPVREV